ncbi:MAG: cob(I)yrinic acid a,c-diamide adenosyltransferase [Planctomycetota bacterium]
MKIYTKTGDDGDTGLFGGSRVSKANPRVEAYGEVDELNAFVGWAATKIRQPELEEILTVIQSDLFIAGADLATELTAPTKAQSQTMRVAPEQVARLEQWIDRFDAECEPLQTFILPGGSSGGAALHLCRTVSRRAERAIVRLATLEQISPSVAIYFNRLSDLFFVLARWVNRRDGAVEKPWKPRGS